MKSECTLIDLSGAPHDRGVQYGRAARDKIVLGAENYLVRVRECGLSDRDLDRVVQAYMPMVREWAPEYVDEMEGIAEGADVSFSHVVLINARTELLKLAGNAGLRASLLDGPDDGCSTIVVQPERSATGRMIHGHNWDWKASCVDTCVVLRIRQDKGPDILTFTEAGGLARFGVNSMGIAVTGNYLESERDYKRLGIPLALIRRRILEQSLAPLAFGVAYNTPKSASNNLMLSHGPTGVVHSCECAPDETFVVEPENGVLVHTNHWLSPVALTKLRETGIVDTPCSYFREQRLRRLLPDGLIGEDAIRFALADTAGSPWSVCVPPRASTTTGETSTVACLMIRPETGEMDVAMAPYEGMEFAHFTLSETVAADNRLSADG